MSYGTVGVNPPRRPGRGTLSARNIEDVTRISCACGALMTLHHGRLLHPRPLHAVVRRLARRMRSVRNYGRGSPGI
jgi:hypothetical protein